MVRLRINELLEEKGKTAYWLSIESGLPHSAIYNLRYGKLASIQLKYIEALCKALECTPGDLIMIEEQKLEPRKKKAKG
jgi:putative transcriptional regulator